MKFNVHQPTSTALHLLESIIVGLVGASQTPRQEQLPPPHEQRSDGDPVQYQWLSNSLELQMFDKKVTQHTRGHAYIIVNAKLPVQGLCLKCSDLFPLVSFRFLFFAFLLLAFAFFFGSCTETSELAAGWSLSLCSDEIAFCHIQKIGPQHSSIHTSQAHIHTHTSHINRVELVSYRMPGGERERRQ